MLKQTASYPHGRANSIFDMARALQDQGLAVFPCASNKMPARPKDQGGKGFEDATQDPDKLRWLYDRWPGPLIGVRTGEASDLDVLDLDLQHEEADEWYGSRCVELHHYRMHQTRSGGIHILFRHSPGLRNSANRIHRHVDVRAEGGYIIHWPSAGHHILNETAPITAWPEWLLEKAFKPEPAPVPLGPLPKMQTTDRYVERAVENAVRNVASMKEGGRNDILNRECFGLMRFVQEGRLSASFVAEVMTMAGISAGLNAREVERTVASALRGRTAA